MNNTIYRTLTEKCGVNCGEHIIVALSGGADSVTLLDVMLKMRDKIPGLIVSAAHVNHNLRGEESLRDEEFVKLLCKERGVELYIHSADVYAIAKEKSQSIELCAREVRYQFFSSLSAKLGAKVATAHTLSDSQETMLYNICRGTTLHGLCSIPYVRDYIIRPLLDISRTQVEEYCEEHKLSFVQDSTNFDEDMCKRNKIRLAVLPHLKTINDGFDNNYRRLRENLIFAEDFLSVEAEKALDRCRCEFGYKADMLSELHPALRRYAIMSIIRGYTADAENTHILLCEKILKNAGAVMLCDRFTAVCTQGIFRIKENSDDSQFAEIPLSDGVRITYKNKKYSFDKNKFTDNVYRKLSSFCIPCDMIDDSTLIRTRREGDTFTLIGRGITKPLRKLQNELKIPGEEREKSLVVAKGSVILWAEHIGVSLQGAVHRDTKEGILIRIEKDL